MVVAFTSCEACIRDLREKACHLLVGHVGLLIKDQHWHINVAEQLGEPQRGDRARELPFGRDWRFTGVILLGLHIPGSKPTYQSLFP
jgi:hypothetical protein